MRSPIGVRSAVPAIGLPVRIPTPTADPCRCPAIRADPRYTPGARPSSRAPSDGAFRPRRREEWIEALNTPDNVHISVPNSAIYGETIKNYSANDTRRNDLVVGVSYGDSIPQAMEIVRNALSADARVLSEPAPVIAVGELGDSSVNLLVRPWCRKEDYWELRFELTRKLKEELEAGGCSIPFPRRDVHLHPASMRPTDA
jgi:hypothetical protein